jgi:putative transposase
LAELFKRYQRSEKALVTTLMQMVLQGAHARRVKKITTELCGREFSRQTVSNLTQRLDKQVQTWADRPLEEEYPFILADAMQLNIRHHEAVRSAMALIVVGISEDGYREILGLKIAHRETGESWKELLQELKDRGLSDVELATSDAHEGLEAALREKFPGCIWQRCQAHFRRNVIDKTPSDYQDRMHELLDQIFEADSQQEAQGRLEKLASELGDKAPDALEILEKGIFDATAVLALPEKYRKRLRTSNMLERLIQEVRRREKVIRIFPNKESAWRLVGALLAEKHEEWSTGRRYWKMDEFYQWREERVGDHIEDPQPESSNHTLQTA